MASYYKHKATKSRQVPYSFDCEHCGKNSGVLTATISGNQAEYDSPRDKLTEAQSEKLNNTALMSLKKRINTDYANATDKRIFSPAFQDECPSCHKPQSWGVAGMKNHLASTPVAIVIVGILVSLGAYFFTDIKSVALSLAIAGAAVLAAVVVLICKLAGIAAKTRQTTAVLEKRLPEIDWSAAEDLLEKERAV